MLEILPVRGIGDVRPGDDLVALIAGAAPWLADGDIVVVTSKIVSKAEGRLVDVPTGGPEREAARDEVLTAETSRPVARRGHTRIVQTHHGYVMASAGIDASNVDRRQLVLLPKDPDSAARALRAGLRERAGVDVAVIVSDTMGRPWRVGLVDVALGAAGIDALRDYRGEVDPYGNELHITQMAIIDEVSSAAELVKGKCDQVPVAVVRGLLAAVPSADGAGAGALIRGAEHDLFSMGTAEARAAGLRDAATLHDASSFVDVPVDEAAVARAIAVARAAAAPGTVYTRVPADLVPDRPSDVDCFVACGTSAGSAAALVDLGADVHRLRTALLAEGLGSVWSAQPPGLFPGVFGVLAIGAQAASS
ncbi:MAG TPA: coenzyme F420-0:L-glutamate ligase [Micromonosporaceae bacterium]|nr:coenzyme F420-0:L-glutamate ligase [Micromonosporaceae bacterium]